MKDRLRLNMPAKTKVVQRIPGATAGSTSRLVPKAKLKITITKSVKTSTEEVISLVRNSEIVSFQAIVITFPQNFIRLSSCCFGKPPLDWPDSGLPESHHKQSSLCRG